MSDNTLDQSSPVTAEAEPPHYFELYHLAVEMADRISSRRLIVNSFFATVNTGVTVFISGDRPGWLVAAAGIILNLVWWALLKSFRDLNAAKYQVIVDMEKRLSARIFTDEWAILKRDPVEFGFHLRDMGAWLAQYRELGMVERVVPWVFAAILVADLVAQIAS